MRTLASLDALTGRARDALRDAAVSRQIEPVVPAKTALTTAHGRREVFVVGFGGCLDHEDSGRHTSDPDASKLRENIYRILDEILETGIPVEIERKGRILRIVPAQPPKKSKLDLLEDHPEALLCDPEDLIHLDWSDYWKP